MKNKFRFLLINLALMLVFCSLSSCVLSALGHVSNMHFDTDGLPEQDSLNNYMYGEIGASQRKVKLREKPLVYVSDNCQNSQYITFSLSLFIA